MQHDASKVNDKTDLKTELKKIASDKGFRIVDNEGSGNCMFYALSDQLEIAMRIKIKPDELRQILVQYLRKNPKLVCCCLTLCVHHCYFRSTIKVRFTCGPTGQHITTLPVGVN